MSTPRVALAGSCASRDNFNSRFNPQWRERFELVGASNQTSLIALMSPPIEVDDLAPDEGMSDYDRWNVRDDLERGLLSTIAEKGPDLLIVDLFADVFFGVARLPDGRFLTDNRWKTHRTGYWASIRDSVTRVRWQDDEEAFVATWTEAARRFDAAVRAASPGTRIVIHRGWVTGEVLLGDPPRTARLGTETKVAPIDVRRTRAVWRRLDDVCVDDLGWEQIDLRHLRAPSPADHAWGPFWVHYTPDYYHAFEAALGELAADASPEGRRRREAATAALGEAFTRERQTSRQEIRRLRGLVHELRAAAEAETPSGAERLGRLLRRGRS